MDYHQIIAENQRRTILQCLHQAPAYSLASPHLRVAVNAVLAAPMSADALSAQLSWLSEVGLIKVDHVGSTTVARLRERGLDVLTGAAVVSGIERPGPEA